MLEVRQDLHLVQEEAAGVLVARQLRAEDLERDPALREPLFGLVDLPHPTFADQPLDEVLADLFHRGALYAQQVAEI